MPSLRQLPADRILTSPAESFSVSPRELAFPSRNYLPRILAAGNAAQEVSHCAVLYTEGRPALLQDYPETVKTIEELTEFDANDNFPTIIGHCGNLLNILEFFSTAVKEKGWGEAWTWRFLQDFRQSVALSSP